ncbi:MAG: DNA repair protein RecN [Bifidobacteriaceae bacterium]|nr:DNA repair protein RecN [Bifidobacteriaceae bacterium]
MLEELEVRNLGPIAHAVVNPAPGMTAITGETGAGKSMLLNAIRLISGGAANADAVSQGADSTWVQAVFAVGDNPAAVTIAQDAGVEPEDGELFLSRTVPASGRSRAVLGGHSVPRGVLASLASQLIVIHGQADQLRIAASARQRDFLDAYAGDDAQVRAFAAAWQEYDEAQAKLDAVTGRQAEARQRADYLRESIERIDRVNPRPGEYDELRQLRDRVEHSADIARAVTTALAKLEPSQIMDSSDSDGATDQLREAMDALRSVRGVDVFDDAISRLDAVSTELDDIVFQLASLTDDEDEMADLDELNARIHDLDDLKRRWGPELDDVLEWRKQAGFELEDLDASPERVTELTARRDKRLDAAWDCARSLSAARAEAAHRLSDHVTHELGSLAMADASFEARVTARGRDKRLDAHGCDDVEFLFTPFPGAGRLPLGKSASGGELSRLMLSMELAAADARAERGAQGADGAGDASGETLPTFVFDEIDAGVGGKSAAELGKRLARLARGSQVIVVTHLAQVASWASSQFVVAKSKDDDGLVHTGVTQVTGRERVHEIARMLSGSESEASMKHAQELLESSKL